MKRLLLILGLLVTPANAQFNGCPPGFCNGGGGSSPPPSTNFLLIDTGSCLLIDTGSCFLIQ